MSVTRPESRLSRVATGSRIWLVLLCGALSGCASAHLGRDWREPKGDVPLQTRTHVSYAVGYKRLESGWKPANDHVQFGMLDVDHRPPGWPVSLVGKVLLSYAADIPDVDDAVGDYSGTYELDLGVRKIFDRYSLQPFVEGGIGVVGAQISDWYGGHHRHGGYSYHEDSDHAFGYWVGSGVFYKRTSSPVLFGLSVHYSFDMEVDLFDRDLEAGGLSVLLLIGGRF